MIGMLNNQKKSAIEYHQDQPYDQTSTPLCLPLIATFPSFQIMNPELTFTHLQNLSTKKVDPYSIDYNKLFKDKIDPLHRYKLMKWLQIQVFRQKYYREVFAYTAYYFDSYLSKNEKIELKNLQIVALAALLLATKIEGTTFPKLGKEFDVNEILDLQIRICLKLNYFLTPNTYVHILNQYIGCWQNFIDKSNFYKKEDQYISQSLTSFQRYRSIYEKIQCLNMAPQSHRFDNRKLIFNLFYLQNKINMVKLNVIQLTHQNLKQFVHDSFQQLDQYSLIFQEFIQFNSNEMTFPTLDLEIGIYISNFINLPIGKQTPNRKCLNYQSYLRMQTVTEEAIKVMDKLVKKQI